MLRLTATQLKMSGKKWNQGTEMFGVNDKEPWHTYSTIFTGDMNEGHRRVQPTFMKEEQDISSRNKESPIAKNIASMYGGHKNQQWMRPYNKLYEREGGVWRRQTFRMDAVPLWPERKSLPRTKGYRDQLGYFHEDIEQLLTFPMPDMGEEDLKPYVS